MAEGAAGAARQRLGRVLAWDLTPPYPCAGSPRPLPEVAGWRQDQSFTRFCYCLAVILIIMLKDPLAASTPGETDHPLDWEGWYLKSED